MKALILCAGRGTRLRPFTETQPKSLVPVGGKPILEYELDAIRDRVDEIVIVTGYLDEQLRAHLGTRCTFVHNAEYATTNSVYSMLLAREQIEGSPFVLFNGDLVVDPGVVHALLDDAAPTASLVDSTLELIDGEMNVVTREGRIVEFSKKVSAADGDAQSLQITKFGAEDGRRLFARAHELVSAGETAGFPALAYDRILRESAMRPVYRREGMWFEIDTVEDKEEAEAFLAGRSA